MINLEKENAHEVKKQLEDEMGQFFELLGLKVYEMYVSGYEITPDAISMYVVEITKRLELIEEQRELLKQTDA